MRPSERLKEKLPEIRKIMETNEYFTNLRVFGSVANGTDTEDSDIDFLVTMKKECGISEQLDLLIELKDTLNSEKVDLIDEEDLHPIVASTITKTVAI